jgi:predicted dehydrogenase
MSERAPLRAAIVGAGLMGKWHADSVRKIGEVVAVVVDSNPSRADALAHDFGAASTGSMEGVSRDLVDVVHVCTPASDHFSTVHSALLAGLNVICEKPLAMSTAATAELYAVANERGLLLCPVHQYLFQDGVLRVLRNLPALGRLVTVASVTQSAGSDGDDDAARDRLVVDILPHPLSLAARLSGLAGIRWSVARALPGEMQVIGSHAGVSLSIQISTHGRPTLSVLRLTGDEGTAHVDLFHGFASFDHVAVSRVGKIIHPFEASGKALAAASVNLVRRTSRREPAYPGLRELVRRFYDALRAKGPPPIDVGESLDVAAARDTIIAAFRDEGAMI